MHKLLSKYQPGYRILSASNTVVATDGRFRSNRIASTESRMEKIGDKVIELEQKTNYVDMKNVVSPSKRNKAGEDKVSIVKQRKIVEDDSDPEEAWNVLEEFSLKDNPNKNLEQIKTSSSKEKKLHNLKMFLLKNESKFQKDINDITPRAMVTVRPQLTKDWRKLESSSPKPSSSTGRNVFKVSPIKDYIITNMLPVTHNGSQSEPVNVKHKQVSLEGMSSTSFLNKKIISLQKKNTTRHISSSATSLSKPSTSSYLSPRSQEDLFQFTQIRSWVPTTLGKSVWAGQIPKESTFQFSVMSYNVLAQNLLESHPYLYRDCPREALGWPYRWLGIKREILDMQPDIVCLQEVQFKNPNHFQSQYEPFFDSLGYKHVVKTRTGSKDDGCVIFYKGDMFSLEEVSDLEYKIDRVKLLDRDNIALVCRLIPIKSPTTPLVIGTTHLLYNPKRADIRLCQTAMFLAELDRLARTSAGSYLPTIITGDFNSDPLSPATQLLSTGSFQYEGFRSGRYPMPRKLLPDSLGLSDSCQWEVELEQRGMGGQFSTGSGGFRHKFGLQSVYSAGAGVTTFQDKWTMVDYIMYSTDQARKVESQLKLVARLSLPTERNMQRSPKFPSHICPSDHLPLVAQFLLTQ